MGAVHHNLRWRVSERLFALGRREAWLGSALQQSPEYGLAPGSGQTGLNPVPFGTGVAWHRLHLVVAE